ncbi:MAG: exopolyphosphatase [Bacteroidetes bacterium]|nr:exopolyphosphatase [Bacteroidota bacterium]
MLLSSVDIGSNAVRLLLANVYEKDGHSVADKASLIRVPIRLGMDVFNSGRISDERIGLLLKTMSAFGNLLDVYQPAAVKMCATAAMREAENGKDIAKLIKEETNLNIKIIDGLTEARIISQYNSMLMLPEGDRSLFVDVGGGSTEISVLENHKMLASGSFKIGTIRLLCDKIDNNEWNRLKSWLLSVKSTRTGMICMGSGGNINKITKLFGSYKKDFISFKDLQKAYKQMDKLTIDERITQLGLRPDRADVIVPAAKIFLYIMDWAGIDKVIAPKLGLADGLVLEMYNEIKKKVVAESSTEYR